MRSWRAAEEFRLRFTALKIKEEVMLAELEALDYKKVLFYFSEIAAIPHGSGNSGQIADYLEKFAKERNKTFKSLKKCV